MRGSGRKKEEEEAWAWDRKGICKAGVRERKAWTRNKRCLKEESNEGKGRNEAGE